MNWTKNIAESDERFDCYNADDIVIFGVKVDDGEDVQINIYKDCSSEIYGRIPQDQGCTSGRCTHYFFS